MIRNATVAAVVLGLAALPGKVEHVRVEAGLNVDGVRPGDRFEIGVRVTIEKGWHVQSHKPLDEGLIATDLIMGGPDVLSLSPPVFPPGRVNKRAGAKVSEYQGTVLIRVPARATADLKPGSVPLEGVLILQLCNDAGSCLPPRNISVVVPVRGVAAGASVSPANSEWFAGIDSSSGEAESAGSASTATRDDSATPGDTATRGDTASAGEGERAAPRGLGYLLLLAFLAGLILNIMPCVLPVVSIKVLSFVQQAGEDPRRVLLLGLSFAAGMLAFFAGLGVLAMAVPIGPGFLLQRPAGVIILTAVMFGLALSLFGVFELSLPGRAATGLGSASSKEGPAGAFAKGFLATILGTSCTAPILSGVWMSALTASSPIRLLVFMTMGLGMACPYILLSAKPGWMRFLPRPGAWMDTFKQAMGFVMLATALWLVWVLGSQVGSDGLAWSLVFLTVLALGLWLIGRVPPTAGSVRWGATHAIAVAVVAAGGLWMWPRMTTRAATTGPAVSQADLLSKKLDYSDAIPWQPYSPGRADSLAKDGRIVYVDYTARWCVTCLSNKLAVLETAEVRKEMARLDVIPLKADFTNGDPLIAEELERFQRKGVPLNLVYAPGLDKPIKLPELLTRSIVLDSLRRADKARKRLGAS